MDTHAFASLAHVRILLIPVGLIPQASFDAYAEEIRSYETLKLGEIPTETKDRKGEPASCSALVIANATVKSLAFSTQSKSSTHRRKSTS